MTIRSVMDGLKIQRKNLDEWKPRLSEQCYSDLVEWVELQNEHLYSMDNPVLFDVCRGDSLLGFIVNWRPREGE